uniref:Uncharacterized protein n=1 Tax=Rhizophora mucronata TaxID=61149 RepID=A0A2P2NTN1_RHIMU
MSNPNVSPQCYLQSMLQLLQRHSSIKMEERLHTF